MILDGKALSKQIISELKDFYKKHPTKKKFAIISVGDDYASKVYCNMKKKTAEDIGIKCDIFHFDKVSNEDIEQILWLLSKNKNVAGIMIQHPLPSYLNEQGLMDSIPAEKDIDGLSSNSIGKILTNVSTYKPATALGIVNLLKHYNIDLEGKKVLVVGRSQIVGLPLSNMFIKENATVTVAHSKTKNLPDMIKNYDIVVAAIGKAEFLKAEWFKEGQILVDAGYNDGNVGDIDHLAYEKASYYTPVPGGVGPMTVASLMLQLHSAVQYQSHDHFSEFMKLNEKLSKMSVVSGNVEDKQNLIARLTNVLKVAKEQEVPLLPIILQDDAKAREDSKNGLKKARKELCEILQDDAYKDKD